MGSRINTIMQTCFFAISGVLPREEAIAKIKYSIKKTYGKKGEEVVQKNFQAVDQTLANLHEVKVPAAVTQQAAIAPGGARRRAGVRAEGDGDDDGRPGRRTAGERDAGGRHLSHRHHEVGKAQHFQTFVPVWIPELCTQCGMCGMVCPHGVIRAKTYTDDQLNGAPAGFKSAPARQGCSCESATPCKSGWKIAPAARCASGSARPSTRSRPGARHQHEGQGADPGAGTEGLGLASSACRKPCAAGWTSDHGQGAVPARPLFEFSGACAGCGETPYVKLVSQMFGDRMVVANATGCSSIYGGNLPTTPWSQQRRARPGLVQLAVRGQRRVRIRLPPDD
jgi:pyruvate-ferredoxin/flavodoxin oxidoreductase